MQVMLNVALAGIGEKFDLVEVDDAYGENLINGGDAVLYVEDEQPVPSGDDAAADAQGAEGDQDEPPPDPEAPKREQAAWADAHGVHYPKSASGERIAQAIADHLADQEEADAEPDEAEAEAEAEADEADDE